MTSRKKDGILSEDGIPSFLDNTDTREVTMKKRQIILGGILVIVVAAALALAFRIGIWVERNTPTKEVMSLGRYYEAEEDEVVILLDAELSQERARLFEEGVYLPFEMVQELFLPRLYLDGYDDLVLLTTPTQVFCYPLGSTSYTVNEVSQEMGYPVAREAEGSVWIALDFLIQEVDVEAVFTKSGAAGIPGRLTLFAKTMDYMQKETGRDTQVRTEPDVKGKILKELPEGEQVLVLSEEEKGFDQVLTADGVLGYARKKHLQEETVVQKEFAERAADQRESYTSVEQSEPIVLVWHQVFNQTANSYLADKLEQTEGVNVISPTWFGIEDSSGKLTTLANEDYVKLAHSRGIQVWPVVNDFTKGIDYDWIFGSESGRRNLINNLFYFIYTYDLDGINIDFENITAENCRGYIQFLRELSVACRNEGIVLSVDNYVPMAHTAFYDRAEQGILADYVMVMAYDEHYAGSPEAGSVSSRSWVERGITATLEEVPVEKLVVGLPFYTRLWKEQEGGGLSSEACSMNAGQNLLSEQEVTPVWDEETGQYYGSYRLDGTTYRIWLEEERSMATKLEVVSGYPVGGVAFWKLGLEREAVWREIQNWKNQ